MKSATTIDLFGYNLMSANTENVLANLLRGASRKTVAFMNAHCANVAATDVEYAGALRRATHILPDGSGMAIAARMTGRAFEENLNGTDLFPALCWKAAEAGKSIYLLGAKPGVAERAAETAKTLVPDLRIAGTRDGYFEDADTASVIDDINASGADILLVAMGVPMQELWMDRNRDRIDARVVMGVGAQFDFWSGDVKRAPQSMRGVGCEWVWRLALEPRRMFARYVLGNPLFLTRAALHALHWRVSRLDVDAIGKRMLDLFVAGGALLALAPLFLLIMAAIRLESRGGAFFTQTRVGQMGRNFTVYKFRSMYIDAEERRAAMLDQSDRQGVCFKSKNDPRITRIGRILRRTSLDELPQLLNVLKGEMSVVGPRPALPEEFASYSIHDLGRLGAKPGVSGLWQVSGRAEIDFDKMVDMDIAYAKSRSLLLDIVVLCLTFRAVVSGRGAY